ncbi:MAG TPA: N-acetylmuramoyl-L-alanine amidase [Tepidisphaeraceae bacterium]
MAISIGCAHRTGDEIVVDGNFVHTGAHRVVLWTDRGGYNAYLTGHFEPRPPGQQIDQFVIHYDAAGSSDRCFAILQERKLSVHFMLDTDGTIYQTLDTKERAYHATKANARSVGVEIANLGAFPIDRVRPPNAVVGMIQGENLWMQDFTPQQYDSLIKLTAALCKALPEIRCNYPRDASGRLIPNALTDHQWEHFHGILGHYHVQSNKQDPGPAFQWDRVIRGAQALLE